MDKKKVGIYVHIPFCKSKCYYCDFISYANKEKLEEESILQSKNIGKILEEINPSKEAEITIEVNPGTVCKEKLIDYKNYGINRLSIGLQSTDNNILKQIRKNTYI